MKRGRNYSEKITHWVDECAQIDEDRIEGNDAHGLQGVAVHNVACNDSITHLNTRGEDEESDLANDPVVALVDADTPDDQTD